MREQGSSKVSNIMTGPLEGKSLKVGFLGLGIMGVAMVRQIISAVNHAISYHDLRHAWPGMYMGIQHYIREVFKCQQYLKLQMNTQWRTALCAWHG